MSFVLAEAFAALAIFPCCFALIPLVAILIGLAMTAFWVWMLVDACTNPALEKNNDRILWVLVILFAHGLGAIIYFFVARKPKT